MRRTIRTCLALLLTGATFALAGGSLFDISGRVDGWNSGMAAVGVYGYNEGPFLARGILSTDGSFTLSLPDPSTLDLMNKPVVPTCPAKGDQGLRVEPDGLLVYRSVTFDKVAVVKDAQLAGVLHLASHPMRSAGKPDGDLGNLSYSSGRQKASWQYWAGPGRVTGTCTIKMSDLVVYWDYDLTVHAGWSVVYQDGITAGNDHLIFTTKPPSGELTWYLTPAR